MKFNLNTKNIKALTIITFLFLFCFYMGSFAQNIKFQKVYGGYSYDYGNDLVQVEDTGYVLLCTSSSFTGNSQVYILKVDKNGEFVWERNYGGNEVEGASEIKKTNDGNLIIAGYTSSFGNGSYDSYLLKVNQSGDTLWTKHYGGDDWDFTYSLDTCADGGYIMAGKTYLNGSATSDILITKVDANGILQWSKTYGGNKEDVANSIVSGSDGYVMCGTTESYGAGLNDIYVLKMDLNGDTVWSRTYGDTLNDYGTHVSKFSDNTLVLLGKIKWLPYVNNYNTFILKVNNDGTNFWINYNSSHDPNANYHTNCVIEGHSHRVTTAGAIDINSPGVNDGVLFLWTSFGDYQQAGTFGGAAEDYLENVIKTYDYGYATIGTTNSFGIGLSNIFFIKTDTLAPSDAPISVFVDTKNIKTPKTESGLYPNPFNESTTININYPAAVIHNKIQLRVWDNEGREVSNEVNTKLFIDGNRSSLKVDNISLETGLYHYQVSSESKVLNTGNFTILN